MTVAGREFAGDTRYVAVGEIVVAQGAHHFPCFGDVPVVLSEDVGRNLSLCRGVELVGVEIVAHEVAAHGEDVGLAERAVVEGAHRVLEVAVVAYVLARGHDEIRFVVLVEGIRQFELVGRRNLPLSAQSPREVAVAVGSVDIVISLLKEISGAGREREPVERTPRKLVGDVPCAVAVDGAEVTFVRRVETYRVGGDALMRHRKDIVDPAVAQRQCASVAPFVVVGAAHVQVERPGTVGFFGYNVDYASGRARAV